MIMDYSTIDVNANKTFNIAKQIASCIVDGR